MEKLNVAVFFGGCSPEYSVSLSSASGVILNLDPEKYNVLPVGITQQGTWYYYTGSVEKMLDDTWHSSGDCTPALLSPNRGENSLLLLERQGISRLHIDVAFPVLHGQNGEDGTLQGLLELAGIPVAGCGTLASALSMDKDRAHKLVGLEGILVPHSLILERGTPLDRADAFADEIGYPLFVKPVKAGSSYGVTKVTQASQLSDAIALAFKYDTQVILEENIEGFEVGCAVLGNQELTVGEVDEIELSSGFFDFTEKYTLKTSAIHVPARIAPEKAAEIKETAKRIYLALGCRGFARVDMFLTPEGKIVFNEANTIPGFTSHSRYPGMMKAAGHSFGEILTRIIELAFEE
ncbi:MAG: D-alanine--D-serine ligase VanG [Lachnospiraceae bacterium]|jgi:D-alanine---D-serine ligase|nr:D-alanine--D-serine ligase VanG [Lachnospiraceae bacterium]